MDVSPLTASLSLPRILATDLDGTFLPLDGDSDNHRDLPILNQLLADRDMDLVFVTGRHLESACDLFQSGKLPRPKWIICDVGTSIVSVDANGDCSPIGGYADFLRQIIHPLPIATLRDHLSTIDGLRLQEPFKQGPFKLSFYVDQPQLQRLTTEVQSLLHKRAAPYTMIASVDPFNGDGLIDLLPENTSKASALDWWAHAYNHARDSIVFSGDSGNDFAALTAGFRSIIVGNADPSLVNRVAAVHDNQGWADRLYIAKQKATSGVLEGVQRYLKP
ncbi:Mannosylfructose-phosphate phosphatase [Rubripirellula lacrimiformis]|uniref:Mannosylfructose-phosphate phosphatase n=1 Tax=Rubripirellula lacrimiformis TaxID=1930273 RepID=A0A517NAX4_9BACT|nr:HAD-IIB family hydrolase [Rubripirellula lacrimiformis]QDT04286.1 Mannosylfructose-phosphate phosphatase [Rubripirellula lacrimiformis]